MLLRRSFNRERKYLDDDLQFRRAQRQANALALEGSPALDILDIGLGSGHFLAVCQKLGHHCVGLDKEGASNLIKEIRASLGVTAYSCQFYYVPAQRRTWTIEEWLFFLDDLRDNLLKPGGRFVLKLPTGKSVKGPGLKRKSPELESFFARQGGVRHKKAYLFASPL